MLYRAILADDKTQVRRLIERRQNHSRPQRRLPYPFFLGPHAGNISSPLLEVLLSHGADVTFEVALFIPE
jgi:hypothetical protein